MNSLIHLLNTLKFHICDRMLRSIAIFCLLGSGALSSSLGADDFTDGLDAYHESQFPEAIAAFQRSLESGESAAAHHNLALSFYQQDQTAEAIWQLERAVRLAPLNKSYLFKLGALRQQLGLYNVPPTWWQSATNFLPQNTWVWLACASFWIAVALICIPRMGGYRRPLVLKLLTGLAVITLLLSSGALIVQAGQLSSGIVVSKEAIPLHHAPASAAPEAGLARPGERARILDQHNQFLKIKTEADIVGWIDTKAFRKL